MYWCMNDILGHHNLFFCLKAHPNLKNAKHIDASVYQIVSWTS